MEYDTATPLSMHGRRYPRVLYNMATPWCALGQIPVGCSRGISRFKNTHEMQPEEAVAIILNCLPDRASGTSCTTMNKQHDVLLPRFRAAFY